MNDMDYVLQDDAAFDNDVIEENYMDCVLYDALTKDKIDVLREMERRLCVHKQQTAARSTVLHVACQYGSIKCVENILSLHRSVLLVVLNSRRETALHLAAREGHYEVVAALLDEAYKCRLPEPLRDRLAPLTVMQILIRIMDKEGETALHMAVRNNQKDVIRLILNKDPSHSYPRNEYGETPLYLASIRCNIDIIRIIFENSESPRFGGPNGRTALHAALLDDGGHDCVKVLLEKNKDLTKQADKYGWTAFHYVAYNDLHTIVEDLVVADKFVGCQADNKYHGRTALHIAAYQGNVRVMKKLLEYYPDSWEIPDGHGNNILHLAVEQNQKEVIKFILSQLNYKEINNLLIRKNKEGNTPLHLIAKLGCYVQELMDLKTLDCEALNHKYLTPLDELDSGQTDTLPADHAMVRTTLIRARAKRHYMRLQDVEMPDVKIDVAEEQGAAEEQHASVERDAADEGDKERQAQEAKKKELLEGTTRVINTHIIVATLIATVALTAGFTMPGGFDSTEGKNPGSPILLRKAAFQAFTITDAIALLLSISSLFLYFVTIMINVHYHAVIEKLFFVSTMLNLSSIIAMMLAFITGTFAVLAHSLALAISVCIISSSFFIFIFYVVWICAVYQ